MMDDVIIPARGNSQCQEEAFLQEVAAGGNYTLCFFVSMDFI